uniref:Saposin B-type domain-containing protein n=1 Tax=Panagrellus redivivus TaxID=6233 RepID=A0A7E4UYQ9_PANRE
MNSILAALLLVALCPLAMGSCSSENKAISIRTLNTFFGCLSTAYKEDNGMLDVEYNAHEITQASKCFASNIVSAKMNKKCVLTPLAIHTPGFAWSHYGPLQGCLTCQQFARTISGALVTMNPTQSKCFTNEIWSAITEEANVCIRRNPLFAGSNVQAPDFGSKSNTNMQLLMNRVSIGIMEEFRLRECANNNEEWADNSEECLNQPDAKHLQKHCDIRTECITTLDSQCIHKLRPMEDVVCGCLDTSLDELTVGISSIFTVIKDLASNRQGGIPTETEIDTCHDSIKNGLRTQTTDWYTVITSSIKKCVLPGSEVDKYVRITCKSILQNLNTNGAQQLKAMFTFVKALLDAMNRRSSQLCAANAYC